MPRIYGSKGQLHRPVVEVAGQIKAAEASRKYEGLASERDPRFAQVSPANLQLQHSPKVPFAIVRNNKPSIVKVLIFWVLTGQIIIGPLFRIYRFFRETSIGRERERRK